MYTVIIEQPAIVEAEEAYLYIRKDKPMAADRWFNGLVTDGRNRSPAHE